MPEFTQVPVDEAVRKARHADASDVIAEYMDYIANLPAGQAGCLRPGEGEDIRLVRMRLGAAARKAQQKIIIRRSGDEVYFWLGAPEAHAS